MILTPRDAPLRPAAQRIGLPRAPTQRYVEHHRADAHSGRTRCGSVGVDRAAAEGPREAAPMRTRLAVLGREQSGAPLFRSAVVVRASAVADPTRQIPKCKRPGVFPTESGGSDRVDDPYSHDNQTRNDCDPLSPGRTSGL